MEVKVSCSHSLKQLTESGARSGFLLLVLQSLYRDRGEKERCSLFLSSHLTPAGSGRLPRAHTRAGFRVTAAVKPFALAGVVFLSLVVIWERITFCWHGSGGEREACAV